MKIHDLDVVVIGAGPAGTAAALRAGDLGAKTALVTRGSFGGMAANDGPIPVRTLAHAARLMREARQLRRYGIEIDAVKLDYRALVSRAHEVVAEAAAHSTLRPQVDAAGVDVYEHAGTVHFVDEHTVEGAQCPTLRAAKIVVCAGGLSRRLNVAGFELTVTPADAFALTAVPKSMIVIGAGATGAQVASIFNAFGAKVELFEAGPRIIPTEDADISRAVAAAFREDGITVRESFGSIERFERSPSGIRMISSKDGVTDATEADLAVAAVGWVADAAALQLSRAGVATNERGSVAVNEFLQTSTPNVFAAGDITGRLMLVPQAVEDGFVAATNAISGLRASRAGSINPIGSFTDPEYAQVGLTEGVARETYGDPLVSVARYDETTRPIVDGRTRGFCKLVVDRPTETVLGCHVMGEQAVEVAQMASIAMTAGMTVETLGGIPLSFPTYANVFGRAALRAVRLLAPNA
jgi:pyruvate/2-oxoglutarate dehydrogenase complex dihydrolipoamide dehydrogenase (E3) component